MGSFGYDFRTVDMAKLVRRIAAAKPDVLFVSAYLEDAIALRRELVAQHVQLLANIGTSSSYCMPAFGATLGEDAVGVYASDKPSASTIDPAGLRPDARALLPRANDAYHAVWDDDMSPAALAGFSAAWAFFPDVLPAAASLAPADVAAAARAVDLPRGSLPNGSGLRFGAPGTPDAGDNVAAASVIWEWVSPGEAAVIWPPAFATEPDRPDRLGRVVSRRAAVVAGLLCVMAYVGLAALSGHLSPARPRTALGRHRTAAGLPMGEPAAGPGGDQPAAVRPAASPSPWIPTGRGPRPRDVRQPGDGDRAAGRVRHEAGQIEVSLTVDPVDPATLGSPGAGVTIFGNAYRLQATYQPSGDRAKLVLPLDAVLIYPVTPNLHASVHQLSTSPDGQTGRRRRAPIRWRSNRRRDPCRSSDTSW